MVRKFIAPAVLSLLLLALTSSAFAQSESNKQLKDAKSCCCECCCKCAR